MKLLDRRVNLIEIDMKKLLPGIHEIDLLVREVFLQFRLQRGRILSVYHRMDIEGKWDRRVTKLPNSVERLEAPRHADFVHILPKRPDVGDDVNMPTASQLRP